MRKDFDGHAFGWFGNDADTMRFRRSTEVHGRTELPGYWISTVGDWHPLSDGRRMEIGFNRFYETMVFIISPGDALCPCGCGRAAPERIHMSGLEMRPANTEAEADANHEAAVDFYLKGGAA